MISPRSRRPRAPLVLTAAVALAVAAATFAPASGAAEGRQSRPGTADPPDPYYPALGNRGYDVEHYDVALRFDPDTGEVRGDTTVTARSTERLRRFNLDLAGMTVRSVGVDGSPARTRRVGNELVVRPRAPIGAHTDFQVRIRYAGAPEPASIPGIGAPSGWLPSDGGVVTLNEPGGARTWFPANDHPTDKASFTFRLDVPHALTAVANGALTSREDRGERTTWTWDQPAPMATYLAQLAIGDLTVEDAGVVDGVTIRHAFAPGVRAAAASAAERTPEMLRFLASWFGPFPFATYGVLAPDSGLSGVAFEGQTLSVFAPDVFTDPRHASRILSHELAHQWFGDWVSPASWAETWLNEGFATYADWLWSDTALGASLQRAVDAAYERASRAPSQPAADPGREAMFSPTLYARGALTLHALRATVGDDGFVQILRTYLERFGGKTASTDDFVAVASEVAGRDLERFFVEWLGPGAPPPLPGGAPTSSTPPQPPT